MKMKSNRNDQEKRANKIGSKAAVFAVVVAAATAAVVGVLVVVQFQS